MSTEAIWTPATEWCPHPEWWTADPDDADKAEREVAALVAGLVIALQPEVVVETGTATGATAAVIGSALKSNGHGRLWTVEIDPDAAAKATELCAGLPVTVACADTMDWWPPELIDFAWIDSGLAEVRVEEVCRWRAMFRPGAVIAVHDTAPTCGRHLTKEGMERLFDDLGWPLLNLRTPRGVMLGQVP